MPTRASPSLPARPASPFAPPRRRHRRPTGRRRRRPPPRPRGAAPRHRHRHHPQGLQAPDAAPSRCAWRKRRGAAAAAPRWARCRAPSPSYHTSGCRAGNQNVREVCQKFFFFFFTKGSLWTFISTSLRSPSVLTSALLILKHCRPVGLPDSCRQRCAPLGLKKRLNMLHR